MPTADESFKRLYDRFNARDMEPILAVMSEDVLWANAMEGGHISGREGVRSYWTRQWTIIDPHVEPISFSRHANGVIEVEVRQIVRDLAGKLLSDRIVRHIFRMDGGLITRFDSG
jgi:ketosteroid isomerase-like protein